VALTALVNPQLKVGVSQLGKQWRELNGAYKDFTKKKLAFAQKVAKLWDRAKKMDETSGGEFNETYLKEELRELIQSDSKSVLSKWVSIGQNAPALLPYAQSLPPQRDSLYALSLASEKRLPIHRWISKGSLSSESTVRQVLTLTKRKKTTKVKPSKMMGVLRISFPESEAIEAFSKYQIELEHFLDERGIPYTYSGIFARYEADSKRYYQKLDDLHLRFLRKYIFEKIKERVDYNLFKAIGNTGLRKVSFKSKLKKIGLALEDIDVHNCTTFDELEDLYKRMELDENADWTKIMSEAFDEALSKCPVPRSVEMISSVPHSKLDQNSEIVLPTYKRRNLDFTDVKVL